MRDHLGDDPQQASKAKAYLLALFDGDSSFGLNQEYYKDATRIELGLDLTAKSSASERQLEDAQLERPTSAPALTGSMSRTHSLPGFGMAVCAANRGGRAAGLTTPGAAPLLGRSMAAPKSASKSAACLTPAPTTATERRSSQHSMAWGASRIISARGLLSGHRKDAGEPGYCGATIGSQLKAGGLLQRKSIIRASEEVSAAANGEGEQEAEEYSIYHEREGEEADAGEGGDMGKKGRSREKAGQSSARLRRQPRDILSP